MEKYIRELNRINYELSEMLREASGDELETRDMEDLVASLYKIKSDIYAAFATLISR